MSDVKAIFNNTFKIYRSYQNDTLFYAIINNLSDEELSKVSAIMTDTYNFYIKYQNVWKDEDWMALIKESHEIDKKYDSKLCRAILLDLLNILEKRYND